MHSTVSVQDLRTETSTLKTTIIEKSYTIGEKVGALEAIMGERMDGLETSMDDRMGCLEHQNPKPAHKGDDQAGHNTTKRLRSIGGRPSTLESNIDASLAGFACRDRRGRVAVTLASPASQKREPSWPRRAPHRLVEARGTTISACSRHSYRICSHFRVTTIHIKGVTQNYFSLEETKRKFQDIEESAFVGDSEHFHALVSNLRFGDRQKMEDC